MEIFERFRETDWDLLYLCPENDMILHKNNGYFHFLPTINVDAPEGRPGSGSVTSHYFLKDLSICKPIQNSKEPKKRQSPLPE